MAKLGDILHQKGDAAEPPYTLEDGSVDPTYTISERCWRGQQKHKERHKGKGHGFGYILCGPNDIAPTLTANYAKDPKYTLIKQEGDLPRRLTERECARLMGFPDSFRPAKAKTNAYRQFGNAVIPQVVGAVLDSIVRV